MDNLDDIMVNAFLIFKKLRQNKRRITLTQFKVDLARQLLEGADISDYSSRGRPRSLPIPVFYNFFSLFQLKHKKN